MLGHFDSWRHQRNRYHYQSLFMARCGQGILVFYEGAPKNGKTQLDEHNESCELCKKLKEKDKKMELTERQQFYFDEWIQRHIKEYGHDFVWGFYIVTKDANEHMNIDSSEYEKWLEEKKIEYLKENEAKGR
jgi:hypothetical protein